jgi:hypothetical protein
MTLLLCPLVRKFRKDASSMLAENEQHFAAAPHDVESPHICSADVVLISPRAIAGRVPDCALEESSVSLLLRRSSAARMHGIWGEFAQWRYASYIGNTSTPVKIRRSNLEVACTHLLRLGVRQTGLKSSDGPASCAYQADLAGLSEGTPLHVTIHCAEPPASTECKKSAPAADVQHSLLQAVLSLYGNQRAARSSFI